MTPIDRARWRAWGGVADIMGLGNITFEPLRGGWMASARGHRGEGETGADALAALCRAVARGR